MMVFEYCGDHIECHDWCDLAEDEVRIAIIVKSPEDGNWRADIKYNMPLQCGHLKRLAKKVSDLNIEGK